MILQRFKLIYFFLTILIYNVNSKVMVHMDMRKNHPLRRISFCLDCNNPQLDGSVAYGLAPKHFADQIIPNRSGELITCVPNYAESDRIFNHESFENRIVLVNRGKVSLLDKCIRLQKHGAQAIIIVDDNQCDDDFSYCGNRAGSVQDGGFSPFDEELKWRSLLDIPILLIKAKDAERIRSNMTLRQAKVSKYGIQNITVVLKSNGEYDEL